MKNTRNTSLKGLSKSTSGITLIALVITIVVLLILASATINLVIGDDGIIKTAKNTVIADAISKKTEQVEIAIGTAVAKKQGVAENVTVEEILGEIQRANNSTQIYAVKDNGVITQGEGTTKFPASILFPEETTGLDEGIRIDIDDKLNITESVKTEVDSVEGALAEVEVNKAELELNLIWENGTPKVTYTETTGANVTIQYMVVKEEADPADGTFKDATGGVISETTLALGDTVYVIASKDGKQSQAATVPVIDETAPVITKFEIKGDPTEDSITVEVTATDNESGLATTNTYTYYKDGIKDETSTTSNTHTYANLTAGTYTLKVEVVDKAGNKAEKEIKDVDKKPPVISKFEIKGDPTENSITVEVTATDNESGLATKAYTYYINGTKDGESTESTTHTYANLTADTYTLKVEVVDKAGNPASAEIEGTIEEAIEDTTGAGIYDADGNMLASWDYLVTTYNLNVEKDYTSSTYKTNNGTSGNSMYYVLQRSEFSGKSGLTVVMPGSNPETAVVNNEMDIVNSYEIASINKGVRIAATNTQITKIGEYAFYSCSKITSVTIGNSVTSIGWNAFYSCSALTSVTIPDSVTSIGESAFEDCNALTSVTIPDSVTSIGECAFDACRALTSVTIGNSVTSIGDYTFSNCYELTSVTIPDSVTSIGDYAFSECEALTSVTIPDSVTSIGDYAFYSCSVLSSVTIGNHVTTIGSGAFSYCSELRSVIIPDSVTGIAYELFRECDKLTYVSIGSGVEYIDCYAFYNCSSLNLYVPSTVKTLDKNAFSWCKYVRTEKDLSEYNEDWSGYESGTDITGN